MIAQRETEILDKKTVPTTHSNAKFRTTHCEKPLEVMTENSTSKTQIHVQRERFLPEKQNPKSSGIRNPGEPEILISQSTAKLENKRLPIPRPPTPPKTKKEIEKRPIQKLKEMLKKIQRNRDKTDGNSIEILFANMQQNSVWRSPKCKLARHIKTI
jgi:hypothetical protein